MISRLDPPPVVLSPLYQLCDLALKSQIATIRYGFLLKINSRFNSTQKIAIALKHFYFSTVLLISNQYLWKPLTLLKEREVFCHKSTQNLKVIKNTGKWSNNKHDNLHLSSNTNSTDNFHKEKNTMHSFNDVIYIMTTIQ